MIKLDEKEIRHRLQRLNNYEFVLYPRLKERSDNLRIKYRLLKEENHWLREENKQIEKIQLELEELREMVYGRKQRDRYFTFLRIRGISLDNNKAERSLRRVVLKRKKSFGCKSQKGANVLSILYSVVFSLYWSHPPEEFFHKYQEALGLSPSPPSVSDYCHVYLRIDKNGVKL